MTVSDLYKVSYLLVQEEYGIRHWIGVLPSGMTRDHIITWWKSLPSVGHMFFNPSQAFPMPLIELEDIAPDDADRATWQWADPTTGQEHILDRSNVVLFAHVHMDDDSYLKIPQGEYIHHAGYGEMPFADEDDDEPPTEAQIREWASESELSRRVFQALHPELKL